MRAASGKREHSMSVGFRAVQWNRAKLVYAVGARILLLPGATVLWPFVLSRWLKFGRAR